MDFSCIRISQNGLEFFYFFEGTFIDVHRISLYFWYISLGHIDRMVLLSHNYGSHSYQRTHSHTNYRIGYSYYYTCFHIYHIYPTLYSHTCCMFVSDYIATYHIYSHSLYRILNICFRCLMLACHMIYFYTYYHHIPQHFQSYYMVIYYHSLSQVTCTSPPRNFWMNEDTHHNLSHFYMAQVCILSDHNPYTLSLPKCDFFHNPSRNLVSNSPWIYFNPLTDFSC